MRTIPRHRLRPVVAYSSDLVTLYLGDARRVLPDVGGVDLVVTDPPYGIHYRSDFKREKFRPIEGDHSTDLGFEVLSLAVKTYRSKHQHLYVFGDFDLSRVPSVGKSVELVWDKVSTGMGDLSLPYSRNYEHIQFARVNVTRSRENGGLAERKRKGAVLRYQNVTGAKSVRHPTEKPIGLLRELIESSSLFGEVVLDPFMGVGSTGVAAVLEGRKFVGVEVDRRYANTAVSRIKEAERLWKAQAKI